MKFCPLCGANSMVESVKRADLPVLQNVVWPSRAAGLAAPTARFELATCGDCGFSCNVAFDPEMIVYDESYDNCVPSQAFRAYYLSVIEMLLERFAITDGRVYDIGCGKGEFLKLLCDHVPSIDGIGIDPSCQPQSSGNFRLEQAMLQPGMIAEDARLVVLRHVLEHIADPAGFLRMIRESMPDVPLYIEVPDLGWILRNGAFWDFCYEHCNYFDQSSLAACARAAGFAVVDQGLSFGDQYQWLVCRPAEEGPVVSPAGGQSVEAVLAYLVQEEETIERLRALAAQGGVAIWGMATKGVILSTILGHEALLGGVDINPGKQGQFAPASGLAIHPPEWLKTVPAGTRVLVMNPNYMPEITHEITRLGADVVLIGV